MRPPVEHPSSGPRDRALLPSALGHLIAARLALWLLPLGRVLGRAPAPRQAAAGPGTSVERLADAVRAVGRWLPGLDGCLVQSIAAQALLTRRGYAAQVRLGVGRDPDGLFKAHAWVESEGRVVLGDPGLIQHAVLPLEELARR